jgi:uncharacterized protein
MICGIDISGSRPFSWPDSLFRFLSRVWYGVIRRRVRPGCHGGGAEEPSATKFRSKGRAQMNRRSLVLAVLACADGRSFTPVQIQKALFVICRNVPDLIDEGPGFNFEAYDYGPFDSSVYTELSILETNRCVVIAPSGIGRWNTYAATDTGLIRGRELLGRLSKRDQEYLRKISDWVRSLSFSALVKAIYDAYPEMRANSIFRG